MDYNEYLTRRELIDKDLLLRGWDVNNLAQVRIEVDTKQSDFRTNDYKHVSETLKNNLESKYADYVLLDDLGAPLAIIEAKRTSKDPFLSATTQAEEYAKDIKAQTGKDVFIFLSNGYEVWFWNWPNQNPRMVKGFFTKEDLMKLKWINENKVSLETFEVSKAIVSRLKVTECVKRVVQKISGGKRKALLVMATGTGKTRAAMAIIDILKHHKWIKKVLFIADRKQLRDQAYNKGYKVYFEEEAKDKILSGTIDTTKNLYVTTIQTLQECYQDISPAYFDLIISDEAHRSIFNKWKDIFTYYDAIQIGLTATPREAFNTDDMRDSFRFFNCEDEYPDALYDYEEAVHDRVLVDFKEHTMSAQTKFQLQGLKSSDITRSEWNRLLSQGIDPENIDFQGSDFEKKFVTKGTNDAIVREFMENAIMDKSGTLPAKSIIFALSKMHAKRLYESFELLYPDMPGLAKVIVSDDSRAQKSIENFEKEDFPRVAISVDMLDTGIDVPEVCNLVFAKPVLSKIKFWQMIGRGTRADNACSDEYRHRLPDGKKTYFKIFDFWNNFERFDMKPEGEQSKAPEAVSINLFRTRVSQLQYFMSKGNMELRNAVYSKILNDINALSLDNVIIRDKIMDIEKAKSSDFFDRPGINHAEFLNNKISYLMKYKQTNYDIGSFELKCEKLGLALSLKNEKEIQNYSKQIAESLEQLPENVNSVRDKLDLLRKARTQEFWNGITYEDAQMLLIEFSDLMRYRVPDKRQQIIVDLSDAIVQRKIVEFVSEGRSTYVKSYVENVESKIKELVNTHPTILKILRKEKVTEEDLENLEETLNSMGITFNEQVLQEFYKGSLVQFIKEILGLVSKESAEKRVQEAFETFMIENNKQYNANQLNFLKAMQTVFLSRRKIDMGMLYEAPFSNFGVLPTELFEEDDLNTIIGLCNELVPEL
jgi:type I restriction enzyme, R subunit